MHSLIFSSIRIGGRWAVTFLAVFAWSSFAWAQTNGTWINTSGGLYGTASNWADNAPPAGGDIANGATATANFNTLNINGEVLVTLDSSRTLGNLVFGDTDNAGTPGIWTVIDEGVEGNVLTLNNGGSSPEITINELGPVGDFDDAFIDVGIAGTNGFTKLGSGILTLDGPRNTISGNVNVNVGTLRLGAGFLYSADGVVIVPQTIGQFNVANGATLEHAVAVNNVSVAAGGTSTLHYIGAAAGIASNVTAPGTGETLNVNIANANQTLTAAGAWTGFNTVNITGLGGTPSFFRMLINNSIGGAPPVFNNNSFATTHVNVDNTQLVTRTNSGGNDINIGALSGTSTAVLAGGNSGTIARYHIGALGDDTQFAGSIITGTGILVEKTGAGILTLSGNLTYTTTNNATPNLRGGVTRILEGTLAMSGGAAIPGGITDGGLGDLYTTIDVRTGATFDVSGASGTYSTAALQQVIGVGTVQGNYNHDQGRLMPGDVPQVANPNGNVTTPTIGTLTFDDNLTFTGSGEIVLDMAATPAGSAGEGLQVNGTTILTGSSTVVRPSFLGTIPTSGTYKILTSDGGFTGAPTGWTVAWPGRGAGPSVAVSGNQLQFNAVPFAGHDLDWKGTGGSSWDFATQNWHNYDLAAQDEFVNGDDVVFKDTWGPGNTAVSNFTVNLTGNVQPGSVTVNSTNNYTFGGSGVITGTASFTKQGSSTVILQKTNTFTGDANIQAGTVDAGAFQGALGTGDLNMSGGTVIYATIASGAAMSNATLNLADSTTSTVYSNGAPGGGAGTNPLTLSPLAGTGELVLRTAVNGRTVDMNANNTAFSGDLTISPDSGGGANSMTVRFNGPNSGLANSTLNLVNGAAIRDRQTAATTIALGALVGDSTAEVGGFTGGSTSPQTKTWEIGGLDTSTTFAGTITNGLGVSGGNEFFAATAITKVGDGVLTLTGENNYAGVTTVNGGTLQVNGTHVSDDAPEPDFTVGDYIVNSGGTLGGTGTIGDGVDPVLITVNSGGAIGPGASIGTLTVEGDVAFTTGSIFEVEVNDLTSMSDRLTVMGDLDLGSATVDVSLLAGDLPTGPHIIASYSGTLIGTFAPASGISFNYGSGTNSQITMTVTSLDLVGDYNNDGKVSAADYTVWRDHVGANTLTNRDPNNAGPVDDDDYDSWIANYGQGNFGSGAGAGTLVAGSSVPEPASWLLAAVILVACGWRRRSQ